MLYSRIRYLIITQNTNKQLNKKVMKNTEEVRNGLTKLNDPKLTSLAYTLSTDSLEEIRMIHNELKRTWDMTVYLNKGESEELAKDWLNEHLRNQKRLKGSLDTDDFATTIITSKLIGGYLATAVDKVLVRSAK